LVKEKHYEIKIKVREIHYKLLKEFIGFWGKEIEDVINYFIMESLINNIDKKELIGNKIG
jgi:hypothetical protein